MLTHIVLFKLNDHSPQNVARVVAKLRTLEGEVPTLRGLEVGSDIIGAVRSFDVALVARFDDLAGMEAYQVHPFHVGVLDFMK